MADKPLSFSMGSTRSRNESKALTLDESVSRYFIPVISNTILIKNCQAKVLGDAFTPWSDLSDEMFVDTITYQDAGGASKLAQQDTCEATDLNRIESELIDLDYYFSSDSSSDGAETVPEEEPQDLSNLAATLRLLEEVSYRILGEKTVTIPKIEKVVISRSGSDHSTDEDDKSEESADKEGEEDEDSSRDVEFLDHVQYSEFFVENLLQTAKEVVKFQHDKKIIAVTFTDNSQLNIVVWPSIQQFTVEVGIDSIDKYIQKSFILVEAWKYKITHLLAQSDKVSDFYFYEVKFCIPTFTYPIAQATVSVYFTIEVSRVIPKTLPVKVTFTVESLRRVMDPCEVRVNDDMLLRVLYSKLAVFKELYF